MADIVAGIIGRVLFLVFLGFVLVKISDVAFWIVCAGATACMIYAFWGEAVQPVLRRANGNGNGRT